MTLVESRSDGIATSPCHGRQLRRLDDGGLECPHCGRVFGSEVLLR
jgi:hypothetical protein